MVEESAFHGDSFYIAEDAGTEGDAAPVKEVAAMGEEVVRGGGVVGPAASGEALLCGGFEVVEVQA
jgi:hypothetical protein